jgi:MFS family permease
VLRPARSAGEERQHYNVTLAVLTFAGIAFALQQTMIIPALPILQREFDTSAAWAAWLLTGFLLSASVSTPLLGKLGDQYGKERMLLISLSVFLAGSIGAICSMSAIFLPAKASMTRSAAPSSSTCSATTGP